MSLLTLSTSLVPWVCLLLTLSISIRERACRCSIFISIKIFIWRKLVNIESRENSSTLCLLVSQCSMNLFSQRLCLESVHYHSRCKAVSLSSNMHLLLRHSYKWKVMVQCSDFLYVIQKMINIQRHDS